MNKRKFFSLLPAAPLAFVALAKKEEIVPDYISIPMNGFVGVDLGDGFVGVDLGEDDHTSIYISRIDDNQIYSSEQVRSLIEAMVQFQGKIIT